MHVYCRTAIRPKSSGRTDGRGYARIEKHECRWSTGKSYYVWIGKKKKKLVYRRVFTNIRTLYYYIFFCSAVYRGKKKNRKNPHHRVRVKRSKLKLLLLLRIFHKSQDSPP